MYDPHSTSRSRRARCDNEEVFRDRNRRGDSFDDQHGMHGTGSRRAAGQWMGEDRVQLAQHTGDGVAFRICAPGTRVSLGFAQCRRIFCIAASAAVRFLGGQRVWSEPIKLLTTTHPARVYNEPALPSEGINLFFSAP